MEISSINGEGERLDEMANAFFDVIPMSDENKGILKAFIAFLDKRNVKQIPNEIKQSREYWIDAYLKTRNISVQRMAKSIIRRVFRFIDKHPLDINYRELKKYIIDNIINFYGKKQTIKCHYATIKDFFGFIQDELSEYDIDAKNPMPRRKFLPVFKDSQPKAKKPQRILPDKMREMLEHCRTFGMRKYMAFNILAHTGMRKMECLTIRIEDINFENRYIITGIMPKAQKSSDHGSNPITFYITEKLAFQLEQYIDELKRENPNEQFLFPSISEKSQDPYVGDRWLARCTKKLRTFLGEPNFVLHWLRKSLISNRRFIKECPPEISRKLTNHKNGKDTQETYYEQIYDNEMRELYDKYHPYDF